MAGTICSHTEPFAPVSVFTTRMYWNGVGICKAAVEHVLVVVALPMVDDANCHLVAKGVVMAYGADVVLVCVDVSRKFLNQSMLSCEYSTAMLSTAEVVEPQKTTSMPAESAFEVTPPFVVCVSEL